MTEANRTIDDVIEDTSLEKRVDFERAPISESRFSVDPFWVRQSFGNANTRVAGEDNCGGQ